MNPKEIRGIAEAYNKMYPLNESVSEKQLNENPLAAAGKMVSGAAKTVQGAINNSIPKKNPIQNARKVLPKAGAGSVTKARMAYPESYDSHSEIYDIIMEYLLSDGYAETNESAANIMANMSEAWRDQILEELELDENRRAARAAGGYKDDSKKQPDPSKAGFTGVGNMSIDAIRKMSARIEKEKKQ
jgi:hypothetical protein